MEMISPDGRRNAVIDIPDQSVCSTAELVNEHFDRCIVDNALEVPTIAPTELANFLSNKKHDLSEFSEIL